MCLFGLALITLYFDKDFACLLTSLDIFGTILDSSQRIGLDETASLLRNPVPVEHPVMERRYSFPL